MSTIDWLIDICFPKKVVAGSRFPDGYDLLIGTSDKGEDVAVVDLPKFEHALIVFGGKPFIDLYYLNGETGKLYIAIHIIDISYNHLWNMTLEEWEAQANSVRKGSPEQLLIPVWIVLT